MAIETIFTGEIRRYELWEFKSGQWMKLSDTGPSLQGQQQLVYDSKHKSAIIIEWVGGKKLTVWEWIDEKWRSTDHTGMGPSYREKFPCVFNPKDNSAYIFGGRDADDNFLNDCWRWDGKNWLPVASGSPPSPRASARLLYTNTGLSLYGGVGAGGLSNDLWQLKNNRWILAD
jgi:hypothetical protein